MAYTIKQNLVDKSKYDIKCPHTMKPVGITIHNTANDASAENEVAYMIRNDNEVSFHAAVDDDSVVIGIPFNRNAWHAGDGSKGKGNRKTIGIEICYSKSGGEKFDKSEANAAHYTATLLKENGWGIGDVYRHADFAKKNCPHRTIEMGWDRFLKMVQDELDKLNDVKPSKEQLVVDGDWGKDTTRLTQKVLGTYQDGIVSNQLTSCKVYLPNALTSSWEFLASGYRDGSAMVRALQQLVGAGVDGWMGKLTVMHMQMFLKAKGFYTGAIDGIMGVLTVKAWQKYINSRL